MNKVLLFFIIIIIIIIIVIIMKDLFMVWKAGTIIRNLIKGCVLCIFCLIRLDVDNANVVVD